MVYSPVLLETLEVALYPGLYYFGGRGERIVVRDKPVCNLINGEGVEYS